MALINFQIIIYFLERFFKLNEAQLSILYSNKNYLASIFSELGECKEFNQVLFDKLCEKFDYSLFLDLKLEKSDFLKGLNLAFKENFSHICVKQ